MCTCVCVVCNNLGAALCRRPSFHVVGWTVVEVCKNEGMPCRVVAATNFQVSYFAADWLAVGSILVHHVGHDARTCSLFMEDLAVEP